MSVFAGHEGWVYIYTGAVNQSGSIAQYVEKFSVNMQTVWANEASVSGRYYDHLTDRRADVSIGGMVALGDRMPTLFGLETALHIKIMLLDYSGSGGVFLYSGRIDSFSRNGALGQTWKYGVQYHANLWSAF